MTFNMMGDPEDGAKIHDFPDGLKQVGVLTVGVGRGKLILNGHNSSFPVAVEMNSTCEIGIVVQSMHNVEHATQNSC